MNQIELAKEIAYAKHAGQFRRDGVTPYIEHPKAVAKILEESMFNDSIIAAGWLHDVLEDTNTSVEELIQRGVSGDVIFLLNFLTKRRGESYEDFIKRILSSFEASQVKTADIIANLNDDPTPKQVKKYAKALKTLLF